MLTTKKKTARLVLGSGGARGIAHIGVIEELEKEGYTITQVAGCSMGALVGGIYCAGYLETYKHWLEDLTKLDVFKLLDFTFSSQGFVKGERVLKAIELLVGDHLIEDFKIPFIAVASDIINRKEVHYTSGSMFKAIRASIAIPTIFTPVNEGNTQLVDGGVLNPMPINLINKMPDDIVVAVNINAYIPTPKDSPLAAEENKEGIAYLKMLSAIPQLLGMDKKPAETVEKFGFLDLLNRSFDLTQDRLTEIVLHVYKPEITVNISREACGSFEFYRGKEMIKEGRKAFHHAYKMYLKKLEEGSQKTEVRSQE